MNTLPFIPKENPETPNNYGFKIIYLTGKTEEHEIAWHGFVKETNLFEFVTKEDIWISIPLSNILKLEWDKRFSKIVALKEEKFKKENELKKT